MMIRQRRVAVVMFVLLLFGCSCGSGQNDFVAAAAAKDCAAGKTCSVEPTTAKVATLAKIATTTKVATTANVATTTAKAATTATAATTVKAATTTAKAAKGAKSQPKTFVPNGGGRVVRYDDVSGNDSGTALKEIVVMDATPVEGSDGNGTMVPNGTSTAGKVVNDTAVVTVSVTNTRNDTVINTTIAPPSSTTPRPISPSTNAEVVRFVPHKYCYCDLTVSMVFFNRVSYLAFIKKLWDAARFFTK